jgi:hypothetical protein
MKALGETAMGYAVVNIALKDGRHFSQVIIDSGYLTRVRGRADVPFSESDILEIKRSDEKWDWLEMP